MNFALRELINQCKRNAFYHIQCMVKLRNVYHYVRNTKIYSNHDECTFNLHFTFIVNKFGEFEIIHYTKTHY